MLNPSQAAAGLPQLWRNSGASQPSGLAPVRPEQWRDAAERAGFSSRLIDAGLSTRPLRPLFKEQNGEILLVFAVPVPVGPGGTRPFTIGYLSLLANEQHVLVGSHAAQAAMALVSEETAQAAGSGRQAAGLLRDGAHRFIEALREINAGVDDIEEQLRSAIVNRQIFDLLEHNKCLNQLFGALESNLKLLQRVQASTLLHQDARARLMLDDAMVEMGQARAMAEIHNVNLSNLMDAYSAAVENNLSLVVQYLSIFVIVAAVPMGIAGIYGMNTPLPFQDEPYALPVLGLLSLLLAALMVAVFKARRIL
ncbi:hypothetical protein CBF45_10965 [Bordetella sp. J329]|jgi:magnesium transporter|uniref:CorA family divalent cation transporter n=1 Tax=Kerstersia gyiorum TaxID=206506 RepID=UPI000FD938BB|nr:CorA family divalent cation transporter [Kerstersia gyiorum]AZV94183.1 hypothetical protein CBF45_10965 [Bordetella sp. J329]MCH4270732.1 hypothetical protein [Kerstersia gyiorum]MCI1227403.1 hypothetical protein [Kerstersia gyiorum]